MTTWPRPTAQRPPQEATAAHKIAKSMVEEQRSSAATSSEYTNKKNSETPTDNPCKTPTRKDTDPPQEDGEPLPMLESGMQALLLEDGTTACNDLAMCCDLMVESMASSASTVPRATTSTARPCPHGAT